VKNKALLAKWGWRFMKEENSLWSQVIRSIHGSNLFGWHASGVVSYSLRSPWINISICWQKVDELAGFKVGDGRKVAFWFDSWVGNSAFSISFPRLYRISLNPKGAVAHFWDSTHSSWSITFRRALKEEELEDFQTLLGILSVVTITISKDNRIWKLEANRNFSVKSLVKHLSKSHPIGKLLEDYMEIQKS